MADVSLNKFETWKLEKAGITLESVTGRVYAHLAGYCASKRCHRLRFIVAELAEHVGVCKRSVQYALRKLEKAELLELVSTGHHGSVYAVLQRVVGSRVSHPPPGQLLADDSRCVQHWRWTGNSWRPL